MEKLEGASREELIEIILRQQAEMAVLQAPVTMLNVGCRMPIDIIRRLLRELFGLGISKGEVVELLDGTKVAGREELARLHNEVRGSPAVCADKTGWHQDGDNGYLWGFFTPTVR